MKDRSNRQDRQEGGIVRQNQRHQQLQESSRKSQLKSGGKSQTSSHRSQQR